MERRTLLKLLGAAALTGCEAPPCRRNRLRVVVAGAGIVGATIAYYLSRAGAAVTVIDKQGPATHASRGTFAWINATWAKQPRHYHSLSQEGVSAWRDLQQSLDLPVRWGGSVEWFESDTRQSLLVDQIAEQVEWGEPARMIAAGEIAELEPSLKLPLGQTAAYSPNDGAVDPVIATQKLLIAAERFGATLSFPCELQDVTLSGQRLTAVETSKGTIAADRLVLATGAAPNLSQRIAGLSLPQRSTPGVIALTRPMPRLLNRVIVAPGVHMHQRDDGRVVLGEQAGAPAMPAHARRLQGRPRAFPTEQTAQQHARRMLEIAMQYVPDIAAAEIDQTYIGWRPLPLDGLPVLGANPDRLDVYVAVMHSGVSLAPVVGQLVAQELTQGVSVGRLAPYRPTRLFKRTGEY